MNHYFSEINNQIDQQFTAHNFYTFLKYYAIPLLIIVLLALVISLLVSRYYFDKIGDQKREVEDKINDFLTELIFSDLSTEQIKVQINGFKKESIFKNKWCKYLILDKLILIKENIKHINPNIILIIYKQFDLHLYSQKLISKRKWYFKSLGFYHYRALDYKIKKGSIKPFLNSKNKYLKSNALISVISLSDEKFDILNNYQDKISKADEMKILDLIYEKKSTIPDTIFDWLTNKNNSIVILAIKLIVRYRETFNIDQIKSLLNNEDIMVRKAIILAVRELYIIEANDVLIEKYSTETNIQNKISILKTLGVIGDKETIGFVSKLIHDEKQMPIKFEIISCINKIDLDFFKNYKVIDPIEKNIINQIILHVNNPHLN